MSAEEEQVERDDEGDDEPPARAPREARRPAAPPTDQDVFGHIRGHEGAKVVLRAALRNGDTHVLMVGPPGSGKSAFMMALENRVPGVVYRDSKMVRPAGLQNLLASDPPILLLDEFDNMTQQCYETLSVPMEHGRVVKETDREQIDVDIGTQIIASANRTDPIPNEILSRFEDFEFEPYDEEEYYEVCEYMLVRQFEWIESKEDARQIAEIAYEKSEETDPRNARDLAQLADSVEEAERLAKAIHDPDADMEAVPLYPDEIERTKYEVQRQRLQHHVRKEVSTITVTEDIEEDIEQSIAEELPNGHAQPEEPEEAEVEDGE